MKSFKFTKQKLVVIFVLVAVGVIYLLLQSWDPSAKDIRHVILISIDTCRADYLSCYGFSRQTTPNMDKFATESTLFSNVISPVPMTLPAHSSMLTGTIPPYNGVHDNFDYRLDESNITLAEVLKEKGFKTGAIVSAFVLDSQFGLDQGFDTYNDYFEGKHKALDIIERKGTETNRAALQWLDENKDEKFFMLLHYFDPHFGYEPPEPFASKFSDNPYAGEIAYVDDCIGQILEKLKNMGLYNSSLIIITGDHGEMLGEHGEETHMYFIYQSAIKVPLLLKLPGQRTSKRIDRPVGIIDIMPTICKTLGITTPDCVQGRDLFSTSELEEDRYIYCESLLATKYGGNSLLGVVSKDFKYIQTSRPELYNLVDDPLEMDDLSKKQSQRALIMQDHLKQILEKSIRKDSQSTGSENGDSFELDEQSRKRLESLGYVGGDVNEDLDFDQSKIDPKDLIAFHHERSRAHYLILQKKYTEAQKICEKMLLEQPEIYYPSFYLARIAVEQGNYAEAVPYLNRVIDLKPNMTVPHNVLGQALLKLGETDEAIKHFKEVLLLWPDQPDAHNALGMALMEQKKFDLAISHFKKELETDFETIDENQKSHHIKSHHYTALVQLGNAYFLKQNYDDSIAYLKQALIVKPDDKEALALIGRAYAKLSDFDTAIHYWSIAASTEPKEPVFFYNIGLAYQNKGMFNEAIAYYKQALSVDPNHQKSKKYLSIASQLLQETQTKKQKP
ncbi:MAG: sulfatase-like hydrolase/transferase [Planctomycetota bacterium]|jgi:arylsulfatase A-like enzyme/Flp pilus assembly protein TadD